MKLRAGLVLALIVLFLDQVTKVAILEWVMQPPRTIAVTGFFALVLVWNRGMSFGMLNTGDPAVPWILGALSVAVAVALIWWLARAQRWLVVVGVALVLGGALGNLIDRALYGAVVDFLLLHAGDWHWPAFNLADSAITLGVAALLWDSLFAGRESRK
ncbi:MAG: signal peptidase II [Rhodospirillaceae bacterium]|nr:signal peptidase II [Rhodospirillaceae bacterium]